jgi:hypothetical protein
VRSPTTVILRGWVKDARVCVLFPLPHRKMYHALRRPLIHSWGKLAWGRYLRVPARRCCWSERSEHANPDMAAGVVLGRSSTLTGRVDSLCRLLAKLRPCRALQAPGRLWKTHRSRTPPSGLLSRSARPHHTDQRIGQCSDDLGAPCYRPSLSLTLRFASMVAGSTAPRPARRAA